MRTKSILGVGQRTTKKHKFEDDLPHRDWAPDQKIRNLVAAVIHQAVDDLVTQKVYILLRERHAAANWIASTQRVPFSFEWCCMILDMDTERMRAGIEQKRREYERA